MPSQNRNIRQRKLQQDDHSKPPPAGARRQRNNSTSKSNATGLKLSFLCLVISAFLLIFVLGTYTDSFHPIIDGIAGHFGYHEKTYAVVMDAGSTGSRVLAFEFHRGYLDGRLVLDHELFEHSKPGLSTYADRPAEGAKAIEALLQKAKDVIPNEKWSETPLVLKATAGLRLLKPEQAENILNEVKEVFNHSGFKTNDESVEIMDGTDEGIFSWYTINFLLNKLMTKNTIAALDLGGGSTQVTYIPKDISKTPLYKNYMHSVTILNSKIDVFTTSYLNAGLMAVRHAVFTNGHPKNITNIESDCVNSIVKNKLFMYGNEKYYITGKDNPKDTTENPVVDYELCEKNVRNHLQPLIKPSPVTLKQHNIAAFSYFYDRAIETGLVDPFIGGEITVGDFSSKAREVCAIANTDQPFMCIDLTFISVLLQDMYGLKPSTSIKLYKKVNGHEISWALGCAYNILTSNKGGHL